jgi:hypothetical protein
MTRKMERERKGERERERERERKLFMIDPHSTGIQLKHSFFILGLTQFYHLLAVWRVNQSTSNLGYLSTKCLPAARGYFEEYRCMTSWVR